MTQRDKIYYNIEIQKLKNKILINKTYSLNKLERQKLIWSDSYHNNNNKNKKTKPYDHYHIYIYIYIYNKT